jgi:hypothetical protein
VRTLDFAELGLGIAFPNPSKNPNKHRQFKEQFGIRFGCRVPMHHDLASPYIKNSPDDLLELHTEPPRRFEAIGAPSSGQGALPEPPKATQLLTLDEWWPEQATTCRFEVEKKDNVTSPSRRLPDLTKLPVRIPDIALRRRPNHVENSSPKRRPHPYAGE